MALGGRLVAAGAAWEMVRRCGCRSGEYGGGYGIPLELEPSGGREKMEW